MLGRLFIRKMSSLPTGGSYSMTKRAHLDDFPVPSGSWQEAYNAKQKKQNLMLVFGVSMLAGVVTYIWQKDPFNFEMMLPPWKYMQNPPAFESPVLEPNFLEEYKRLNPVIEKVTVATAKK